MKFHCAVPRVKCPCCTLWRELGEEAADSALGDQGRCRELAVPE